MDSLPSARMSKITLFSTSLLMMVFMQQLQGPMMIRGARRIAMAGEMISCLLGVSRAYEYRYSSIHMFPPTQLTEVLCKWMTFRCPPNLRTPRSLEILLLI
jgi:hypothetical protein